MDSSRLSIADTSTALRRAEWECLAVDIRAKANALIESQIDDGGEIAMRQGWIDLALANPVDYEFRLDVELSDGSEPRPAEVESARDDATVRGVDDDVDSSRG